jgi:outer membrane protein, adhesin transport system
MKMKLHHLLLLNLFIIIPVTDGSGQVRYQLDEFISEGLENNYSLKITRNRQAILENNVTPGNAGFLPVLDLSTRHSGNVTGTTQNFRDGGTASTSGIYNTSTNAGLDLRWNLFSGFRVQTTYSRLEELRAQGELFTRLSIEQFIARTTSEYYNFIRQSGLMANLEYSVSLSRERFRIDQERYNIGSGSRLQMLQSRVFLNADSSRYARQQEVVRSSLIRLNELIGAHDFEVLISVADTVILVNKDLLLEDLMVSMLDNNTSLMISSGEQAIADLDKRLIESRTYPFVSFNTGYGYTFNTFQAGTLQNQQSMGMNYGITVGINLFDGFNRRREISNALIEIDNRELAFQRTLQEVNADLVTIFRTYENNLRLLEMEYENLETARENMEIAFERYRLGALSGIELREVQVSLLDAEERLLAIQYQTKLAEISLLQISGRIMEYI